ncbi:PREDICTED: myristoylated alanine-rich C-kinase substrate-like, partial [Chinchilla lanigera]|uniref:myristoylated alanine-rich C-kinase substrate-like n=1 Tax=Chinchilla lanigera TaxID=34839 RepID=UPI0006967E0E
MSAFPSVSAAGPPERVTWTARPPSVYSVRATVRRVKPAQGELAGGGHPALPRITSAGLRNAGSRKPHLEADGTGGLHPARRRCAAPFRAPLPGGRGLAAAPPTAAPGTRTSPPPLTLEPPVVAVSPRRPLSAALCVREMCGTLQMNPKPGEPSLLFPARSRRGEWARRSAAAGPRGALCGAGGPAVAAAETELGAGERAAAAEPVPGEPGRRGRGPRASAGPAAPPEHTQSAALHEPPHTRP